MMFGLLREDPREVIYHETNAGTCPTKEFRDQYHGDDQATIQWYIDLLAKYGKYLGRPYAGTLSDGIRELRVSLPSHGLVRLLYFLYGGLDKS